MRAPTTNRHQFLASSMMQHGKDAPANPNNSSFTVLASSKVDGDSKKTTWEAECTSTASYKGPGGPCATAAHGSG